MGDSQKKLCHNWRPFEEARSFVRSLGLNSQTEWQVWSKSNAKPDNNPTDPRQDYKDQGSISMGDWHGTNTIAYS